MCAVADAYQALGGGLCAVAAHCTGDGFGTRSHIGLQGSLESFRQRAGGRCTARVRGSDPEEVDSFCPVVLVVHLGNDDLRCMSKTTRSLTAHSKEPFRTANTAAGR